MPFRMFTQVFLFYEGYNSSWRVSEVVMQFVFGIYLLFKGNCFSAYLPTVWLKLLLRGLVLTTFVLLVSLILVTLVIKGGKFCFLFAFYFEVWSFDTILFGRWMIIGKCYLKILNLSCPNKKYFFDNNLLIKQHALISILFKSSLQFLQKNLAIQIVVSSFLGRRHSMSTIGNGWRLRTGATVARNARSWACTLGTTVHKIL